MSTFCGQYVVQQSVFPKTAFRAWLDLGKFLGGKPYMEWLNLVGIKVAQSNVYINYFPNTSIVS